MASTQPPEMDEATTTLLNTLSAASTSWSKFNLDSRRSSLSSITNASREARDLSQTARKTLASSTKSLKKCLATATTAASSVGDGDGDGGGGGGGAAAKAAITDLAKVVKSTVKSYQEEIDALTKRCKSSDGAVSDTLSALQKVDDPAPLLAAGATNLEAKVGQIHHLLRAMEEMNGEVATEREENGRFGKENDNLRKRLEEAESRAAVAEAKAEEAFEKASVAATEAAASAPSSGGGGAGGTGAGVGGMSSAEREELIQLRREVAEYEVEFRSLKNQDITIRKLESKIADLQRANAEETQKRLEAARQELEADPNVQTMKNMFGAEIKTETIELIKPAQSD